MLSYQSMTIEQIQQRLTQAVKSYEIQQTKPGKEGKNRKADFVKLISEMVDKDTLSALYEVYDFYTRNKKAVTSILVKEIKAALYELLNITVDKSSVYEAAGDIIAAEAKLEKFFKTNLSVARKNASTRQDGKYGRFYHTDSKISDNIELQSLSPKQIIN